MDVQQLTQKLIDDQAFATEAKSAARKAVDAGHGSPEWHDFLGLLGEDPNEVNESLTNKSLGWTTTTTITSPECFMTTTTTGH